MGVKAAGQKAAVISCVRQALGAEPGLGIGALRRRIRKETAQLRARYLGILGAPAAHQDEWLCDNYYILEKECKQALREITQISRKSDKKGLIWLYHIIERTLAELRPDIEEDTLACILTELAKHQPLSEKQFAFLPVAMRCVFLHLAWRACFASGNPAEIAFAVTGFNRMESIDFEQLLQRCSGLEKLLLEDPADIYRYMTDESRRYYRYLAARIARKERKTEQQLVGELLENCRVQTDARKRHIGHAILEHPGLRAPRLRRGRAALLLSAALPGLLCGWLGWWSRTLWLPALCILPVWEVLRGPIWQAALYGVEAGVLPRMDLRKVKNKPKTVVVVATLLPKASELPQMIKRLEQFYFSNSEPDRCYCVLADFKEWDFPVDEKDSSRLRAAGQAIEELNRRYGRKFMLFVRSRSFAAAQNRYSGWERKRGAIVEFVRFIKGEQTTLHTFVGDKHALRDMEYLIALDADTNLLYESAQALTAVAMHPLNRPVVKNGVVTSGYGIIAPKVSTDLSSARATAFSRIMSGCGGVAAYDTRDKDLYQDLLGEGIFAGKGLIDIDSFYALLNSKLPENQVLSHDVLEGAYLRCAYVPDIEMTDSAPPSLGAWLARLHRWTRGDAQNIIFLGRSFRRGTEREANPISNLSRYKLADNLRRPLSTIACFACLIAALFASGPQAAVLVAAGILGTNFASLSAACRSLAGGGFFSLSQKFFTRTLPNTAELLLQSALHLVILPAQALGALDALTRALWRTFISRKNMLEWVASAQSDAGEGGFWPVLRRFWQAELAGIAYLLLARGSWLAVVGVLFSLVWPVAYFTARPTRDDSRLLSRDDRETLLSYNAAMWRYYKDFANAENNYLPPDNVQQTPVWRVAHRTSPTNIGMMMLSTLAARDFDFINTDELYTRLERTTTTLERLKNWNGNLFNWYDTRTLDTLKPEFVSAVDSGNFIGCLVALCRGLEEFAREKPEMSGLSARLERLVNRADLTRFYDDRRHLFRIGYDAESGRYTESHYDFLMSEARLTSYYAIARKLVEKKHWGAMNRTMSRSGSYAGPVSWTGTMFEYYMPHLLLPVPEGSLISEALIYCLYVQKKRTRAAGLPWGISESAFYAFDNNLNYQYKAHGVQRLGVKRGLDQELVISPYSTFLTIAQNPNSSMRNLSRLRALGVYGKYGFYEAVDFTESRVGPDSLAVTRSYMAHHLGMSMVASCNALFGGRMQQRFMRDPHMRSAEEFLQEKIAKNTVTYDTLRRPEPAGAKPGRAPAQEETTAIRPQAPRCMLLTNGELTDIVTDTGAGWIRFGEPDLTRRSTDLLRAPQGFVALVGVGETRICPTMAPFYDPDATHRVEYSEQAVTWTGEKDGIQAGLRCMVHSTVSVQQRQLVVKNPGPRRTQAQALFYFEPVLSDWMSYSAHPAYSKLFITARYSPPTNTVVFSRRAQGESGSRLFLTVGFLEDRTFELELHRENLMPAPAGVQGLWDFTGKTFGSRGDGAPDACCALRFTMPLQAGGQSRATLLICASTSEEEGAEAIISVRKQGALNEKTAAKSPVLGNSLTGRLAAEMLGPVLFNHTAGKAGWAGQVRSGQSTLWRVGISGDLPVVLLDGTRGMNDEMLAAYLGAHSILRRLNIEFDLCIIWEDDTESEKERLLCLSGQHSLAGLAGQRGGVFLLPLGGTDPEVLGLLRAAARIVVPGRPAGHSAADELPEYRPVALGPVAAADMPADCTLRVEGGGFCGGRFYADRRSPLPWSHVLANPQFGTMVSTGALGFTWALNSRENKLTPWYNDICADNRGELLLLQSGGEFYDLALGSRASFSPADALYEGRAGGIESSVRVTVAARGGAKYIAVRLRNNQSEQVRLRCGYYLEPVLGVDRETARHIRFERRPDCVVMHNAYNTAAQCFTAVRCSGEAIFLTRRAEALCGRWEKEAVEPDTDPCLLAVAALELAPGAEKELVFTLSYGATADAACEMGRLSPSAFSTSAGKIRLQSPDKHLNHLLDWPLLHQILSSRIFARCGFYQCGGAFGFRDQLQDVMAIAMLEPGLARQHILRCCAVQFEEGDVLHWWHDLPENGGGLRGVRTRFSDDLLWLPLAVAEYVLQTGDVSLCRESVPYLSAPPLAPGEQERYIAPGRSPRAESVFCHCVRALEKGCDSAVDGLPLIGCGDWNDGFSAVGREGRGKSVWLALFMVVVLENFADLCEMLDEREQADVCRGRIQELRAAVDAHAWDGQWYLRAFYDDGRPMGSRLNDECRIDLLPQAFAVFAKMPDRERVRLGLDNALKYLLDEQHQLVRLFTPAFEHSDQRPGYVKAYPAGIRENGGQYTHAAIWLAQALLQDGRTEEGWRILQMNNPLLRCLQPAAAQAYKLEPYSIPADIYTHSGVEGRGGWSLYTGAASWYFRVILQDLLGLARRGATLQIAPRLPADWPECRLRIELRDTLLHIHIRRAAGASRKILCDGTEVEHVPLDGREHDVEVLIAGTAPE